MWSPKPEIVISLELQQIASKFQRQVRDFWQWQARIKCRQVITTVSHDRQLEMAMWPPKPEILISVQLRQIGWQFQRQIWAFRPRSARRNWPGWLRQGPTTGNGNIDDCKIGTQNRFGRQSCNFWWSIVVAVIWLIFYRHLRKSGIWRWNLDAICQSSRDVIISGLGGHIDIDHSCTHL